MIGPAERLDEMRATAMVAVVEKEVSVPHAVEVYFVHIPEG